MTRNHLVKYFASWFSCVGLVGTCCWSMNNHLSYFYQISPKFVASTRTF